MAGVAEGVAMFTVTTFFDTIRTPVPYTGSVHQTSSVHSWRVTDQTPVTVRSAGHTEGAWPNPGCQGKRSGKRPRGAAVIASVRSQAKALQ